MKSKTLAVTIGSIVLGAGMAFGAVAYANHGHTGNNATTGMGMMGSAPQTGQQTMNRHKGTGNGGHMNAPVTTAANQHGMHGTGKTRNHMDSPAGDTVNQHHGTTDHHKDFSGHHGNNPGK